MAADLDRFLAMVCRELGAADARVLPAHDAGDAGDPLVMRSRLPDGQEVVARFASPPADREAKERRLGILASTFDTIVEEQPQSRRSRPPVTTSLHEELVALCNRAVASNVIIIDANSPVVWGAAVPDGVVAQPPLASSPRMAEGPANNQGGDERISSISRRAVHAVRAWPELAAQRKGKHVRKTETTGGDFLIAHSFAAIYLVVLVFDASFDELRAERALLEAMPRIERLVLALPPLDPDPVEGQGVVAMRKPRRR